MMTKQQVLNMPYGIRYIGQYAHVKLRFTAKILERMTQDPELKRFAHDLTIVYNKTKAHGHISGVFHKNSNFVDTLYRVRRKTEAFINHQKNN